MQILEMEKYARFVKDSREARAIIKTTSKKKVAVTKSFLPHRT